MLRPEENELLTRVGPNTPMGQMLRRYWVPACLSAEVPEPDGTPRRVRLLGERLVAFRDSSGRVGLLEEHCPHRGASLALGRNEECGLRCLYHGWKLDADGNVLDLPVEPPEAEEYKRKVKAVAYPTHEQGDVVWAYLGPREHQPPFPNFEWTLVPASQRQVEKVWNESNWLQAMEGGLDASHAAVLHGDQLLPSSSVWRPSERSMAPRLEVQDTPYGFRFAAIHAPTRDADRLKLVRTFCFAMPFHVYTPPKNGYGSMHIFVPMDDYNTMWLGVQFNLDKPLAGDRGARSHERAAQLGVDLDADYRKLRRMENDYLQDREAMRAGTSFSGLFGQATQDQACQETMGPIYDRTREHLVPTDLAVIRMRRRLLDTVASFQQGGTPLGLEPGLPLDRIRTDEQLVPIDTPWEEIGAFAGEEVPLRR